MSPSAWEGWPLTTSNDGGDSNTSTDPSPKVAPRAPSETCLPSASATSVTHTDRSLAVHRGWSAAKPRACTCAGETRRCCRVARSHTCSHTGPSSRSATKKARRLPTESHDGPHDVSPGSVIGAVDPSCRSATKSRTPNAVRGTPLRKNPGRDRLSPTRSTGYAARRPQGDNASAFWLASRHTSHNWSNETGSIDIGHVHSLPDPSPVCTGVCTVRSSQTWAIHAKGIPLEARTWYTFLQRTDASFCEHWSHMAPERTEAIGICRTMCGPGPKS